MKKQILFLTLLSILLISGINGCPSFPTDTGASKTGVDFSLVSGIDKLSSGKTIWLGNTFNVQVHIENYDKEPRSGKVCIRDDQDRAFGGIDSQCQPFFVKAAEVLEESQGGIFGTIEEIQPSSAEVLFPQSGEYFYKNLPVSQTTARVIVTLKYSQSSRIEALGGVKVPEPESEFLKLSQDPAPITASIEKSISKKENNYQINLGIRLSKQTGIIIFSPTSKEEDYLKFEAFMTPQTLTCKPEGTYDEGKFMKGLVELKKEKLIKCTALVPIVQKQQWPFILKLDYDVELEKEVSYTIKAEIE